VVIAITLTPVRHKCHMQFLTSAPHFRGGGQLTPPWPGISRAAVLSCAIFHEDRCTWGGAENAKLHIDDTYNDNDTFTEHRQSTSRCCVARIQLELPASVGDWKRGTGNNQRLDHARVAALWKTEVPSFPHNYFRTYALFPVHLSFCVLTLLVGPRRL